jgi:hypothetical protein
VTEETTTRTPRAPGEGRSRPLAVERYTRDRQPAWDEFVRASKNGTFLFLRDYMDYHADRFTDHSLLVHDDAHRLIALLPAHQEGDALVSHGGLTFGGFVAGDGMKIGLMLGVFDAALSYLHARGVRRVLYKAIPHIYHRVPAEEDRYALLAAGGRWIRSSPVAVVPRDQRLPYQERRQRGVKKAQAQGLAIARSRDFEGFWDVLSARLDKTYLARPVHTAAEIQLLSGRFPEHIKLFACHRDAAMVAGVVVYESARVARAQYIASTDAGRAVGAVDLLLDHLLADVYRAKPYFDLGTSEVDAGVVNRGLMDQKEGFGARTVSQDHFALDLTDWRPGTVLKATT